jgi:hypothetical protein
MEYLIGVGLALAVCAPPMVSGERERVFYPTMVVVGHDYIVFAVMGSSTPVLALNLRRPWWDMESSTFHHL